MSISKEVMGELEAKYGMYPEESGVMVAVVKSAIDNYDGSEGSEGELNKVCDWLGWDIDYVKKLIKWKRLNKDKIVLSWKEYLDDVYRLIVLLRKYSEYRQWRWIYPVPRGGWILGTIIGNVLGLKSIREMQAGDRSILVVDDLVDTGGEAKIIKEYDLFLAVLYRKSWTEVEPDVSVRTIDKWIVFPYERKNFRVREKKVVKESSNNFGWKRKIGKSINKIMIRDKKGRFKKKRKKGVSS